MWLGSYPRFGHCRPPKRSSSYPLLIRRAWVRFNTDHREESNMKRWDLGQCIQNEGMLSTLKNHRGCSRFSSWSLATSTSCFEHLASSEEHTSVAASHQACANLSQKLRVLMWLFLHAGAGCSPTPAESDLKGIFSTLCPLPTCSREKLAQETNLCTQGEASTSFVSSRAWGTLKHPESA